MLDADMKAEELGAASEWLDCEEDAVGGQQGAREVWSASTSHPESMSASSSLDPDGDVDMESRAQTGEGRRPSEQRRVQPKDVVDLKTWHSHVDNMSTPGWASDYQRPPELSNT